MPKLFENVEQNITEIVRIADEAIKASNKDRRFSVMWRNECAPSKHIGHNNKLLAKYGILDSNGNLDEMIGLFIKEYLNDQDPSFDESAISGSISYGRSIAQLNAIARYISRRCAEKNITFEDGMENDIEKLTCLIIGHACVETVRGKYSEVEVERYFRSFGLERNNMTDETDAKWDSNGVDILLYKDDLIFRFVQVKPVSFMLGYNPDLVEDRKKCLTQNQPFVEEYMQLHFNEGHPKMRTDIIYCFYDKDNRFLNFKGNESDDGVFVTFDEFCYGNGKAKFTKTDVLEMPKVDLTIFKKRR